MIVCVWALSTRLLHWDGLADVADGYWGAHEQARRLEIMSDSHTGAFGAAAIALVAITQVAAVAAILSAPHELPLVAIPAIGRLAATAAAWFGTPARPSGLGRSVMARPSGVSALSAIVAVAGAVAVLGYALGLPGAVAGVAGAVCALGVPHVLAQRFGGVTGDVMGASVILTETLLLVAVALVA